MYYRVATRVDEAPTWQWKSTVLSSLDTLFQFLRLFRALPQDRLRVFSSTSREGLAEQLEQENQGLASLSVTAAQFLHERMLCSPAAMSRTSAREGGTSPERGTVAVISQQASNERGWGGSILESRAMSTLERRREELESGHGGDHDLPYSFSLPPTLPQVLAWMTLLARVRKGELHP
jgi:hypothetical protein